MRQQVLTAVAVSVTKWGYNAADTFDAWMDLLADIFPEEKEKAEAAKEYGEKGKKKKFRIRQMRLKDEEKKNVFFLFNYSDTALVTSGKNFWGQYWCDAINAVNVGEEIEAERSNASVNMEQVYSWDPEIISSAISQRQCQKIFTIIQSVIMTGAALVL